MLNKYAEESKKLMMGGDKIPKDTVIFESNTPGEYSVELPVDGVYEIYCVGPGGSASLSLYTDSISMSYVFQ